MILAGRADNIILAHIVNESPASAGLFLLAIRNEKWHYKNVVEMLRTLKTKDSKKNLPPLERNSKGGNFLMSYFSVEH